MSENYILDQKKTTLKRIVFFATYLLITVIKLRLA